MKNSCDALSYSALCNVFAGRRRDRLSAELTASRCWSIEATERAIDEYVMFLYVASLNVDEQLVPTQEIDCVWETDILQSTAQYMQTCHQLCGQMIHHVGASGVQSAAFARTQALFRQHFGQTRLGSGLLPAAACGLL